MSDDRRLKILTKLLHSIAGELRDATENNPVISAGVCTLQDNGDVSWASLSASNMHVNPGLSLVCALLDELKSQESDERTRALLSKAHRLVQFSLRVKQGEIFTKAIH